MSLYQKRRKLIRQLQSSFTAQELTELPHSGSSFTVELQPGQGRGHVVPISTCRMAQSSRALQSFAPGAWLGVLPCAAACPECPGEVPGQGRVVPGRNLLWKEQRSKKVVVCVGERQEQDGRNLPVLRLLPVSPWAPGCRSRSPHAPVCPLNQGPYPQLWET